jgi:predicted nucleotidyltransferase
MLVVRFGSRKRGDFDLSSDKDVLLLSDDWTDMNAEKDKKKKDGYSVSSFTKNRAKYLISEGSLFFKHIKDEGVLVNGSSDEYEHLITSWKPARSYAHEIEQNLDVLDLLAFIPRSKLGLSVAVDIIISSVRNILIKKLASEGFYVFAWEQIFQVAEFLGLIQSRDTFLFLTARRIKNLYRKEIPVKVEEPFVIELLEATTRIFNLSNLFHYNQKSVIRALPERYRNGSYKQLRAIELMCAEYRFEPGLKNYRQWISDSNYFCNAGI